MLDKLKNYLQENRKIFLLIIVYLGFISLGIPDNIFGVAWDKIYREFNVPINYAGFVVTLLTICSAISAFSSGAILRRLGTGKLLTICAFVTAIGMLGFVFAPSYWLLLLCVIPLGFGQGAIDTGMNFFVAKNYTSRDMSWLHCCWGVGASAGPFLMTMILSQGFVWQFGYGIVAIFQFGLAILFLLTLPLWRSERAENTIESQEFAHEKVEYSPRFWCCVLMFFLYCGVEFSTGLWGFEFLTSCRGFSDSLAGYTVAGYWGMLTLGRFLLGFLANRLGNIRQIRLSMIFSAIGALLVTINNPVMAIIGIGLMGFALATFYPAMMHAAPERFNSATAATIIGYQGGAAMIGVGVIPTIFGYVATAFSFNLLPYFGFAICLVITMLQIKVDGFKSK